jgi:hypothetical protein
MTEQTKDVRTRFVFGPVWNKAVIDGTVTDKEKLVAQAVKLHASARSDARGMTLEALRDLVRAKLLAHATLSTN